MTKIQQWTGTAVLLAGIGLSGTAGAGLSGNVAAVSEYMFRGIAQTGGAAVQGGIDYETGFGLYVGTWASNIGFGGGTEQDVYVGFAGEAGALSYDLGVTWYWYPEEDEAASDLSTFEWYGSLGLGPVSLQAAYGSEVNFFLGDGNGEEALYLALSGSVPLAEGLSLDLAAGHYSGDEIERFLASIGSADDSYTHLRVGLSKELADGLGFALAYEWTDIEAGGFEDDPKLVLGISKSFDL